MQHPVIELLPNQEIRLRLKAQPGLYQLSVVADATQFNWDELYFELHDFGNDGALTGPWDFDFRNGNKPLVPAYWVALNGRQIGLWFFQRVSIEDIEAKRFRGRAAFWIEADDINSQGEIELEFTPYRALPIQWQSVAWQIDPEDILEVDATQRIRSTRLPADEWSTPDFWDKQRRYLSSSHALFQQPLQRAFDWAQAKAQLRYDDVPLLIAAYHLGGFSGGLDAALKVIDETVAQPHWGNPQPDGYSHNGDMGAANAMWMMAWSLHALRDQLGSPRIEKIKTKLTLQGGRFIELALLNRDYWGGSVLQDHGWRSHFAFGIAVLHGVGVLPQAQKWLGYVLPRLQRAVEAMPRDGVIPQSSYGSLFLHLDALAQYRDALLALTGDDLYDEAPFHPIVDYVIKVLREHEHAMILPNYNGGSVMPFMGGNAFLNQAAAKYSDSRAAYLQRVLLETAPTDFYHSTQEFAFYNGALWGFMSYNPEIPLADKLPELSPLIHFEDSGLIHYYNRETDVTLTLRCGPWVGWHPAGVLSGPCDAMSGSPGAGHFVLARGKTPLLVTPDSGYSLQSALCSCLLVDGKGQFGDVGYPMSIPSWKHRGEHIEYSRWDEKEKSGDVRLNLAPAYAADSGVSSYTREFVLERNRIICRDTVKLDTPHILSWLFQGDCSNGLRLEHETTAIFGSVPSLALQAQTDLPLKVSIHETPVVYGYSSASGYAKFNHVRYDTVASVSSAKVDFVFIFDSHQSTF